MPADFLARNYTATDLANAREAGRRAALDRDRVLLDRLDDVRVTAGPAGVAFGADDPEEGE